MQDIKKRVLAIDDDEDILTILDIILQDEGFEPFLFSAGIPVQQIMALKPDLILLDVQIGQYPKTGNQICNEIKMMVDIQKIPVILVSAEADLQHIASQCGADGFVAKPFDILKLMQMLKESLS